MSHSVHCFKEFFQPHERPVICIIIFLLHIKVKINLDKFLNIAIIIEQQHKVDHIKNFQKRGEHCTENCIHSTKIPR